MVYILSPQVSIFSHDGHCSFSNFKDLFIFMSISIFLLASMSMPHVCVQVPQRPERWVGSPGSRVTDGS